MFLRPQWKICQNTNPLLNLDNPSDFFYNFSLFLDNNLIPCRQMGTWVPHLIPWSNYIIPHASCIISHSSWNLAEAFLKAAWNISHEHNPLLTLNNPSYFLYNLSLLYENNLIPCKAFLKGHWNNFHNNNPLLKLHNSSCFLYNISLFLENS